MTQENEWEELRQIIKEREKNNPLMQVFKARPHIVWNVTEAPIFIVTKFKEHPLGLPAIWEETFSILPGEGIDLNLVGLSQIKKDKPETL